MSLEQSNMNSDDIIEMTIDSSNIKLNFKNSKKGKEIIILTNRRDIRETKK